MTAIRTTTNASRVTPVAEPGPVIPQLSLPGILGVWAAAAIPMGLLAWVVAPEIADRLDGPGAFARSMILALVAGLVWQFVLVLILVRREQGTLRWGVLREVLWLRSPRSPKTGRRGGRMWWIVPVLLLGAAVKDLVPKIPHGEDLDFFTFMGTTEGRDMLSGAWGWFAVLLVMVVFNTVLGEELLFRGYLLPRMAGAFGRYDWVANGVLFTVYHLHRWWAIPGILLGTLVYCLPAKRYRSALVSMAVHSAQSVVLVVLVLPMVLQG